MRIRDCNWSMIEEYLHHDDRAVLPLGSTEQHGYLSLCTDALLAEEIALAAAEPLGIPVFPVLSYGLAPYFMAFPGTVSVRVETYCAMVEDILESIYTHGFRRILIVNGHGGNQPAFSKAQEWACRKGGVSVIFHNWWSAPKVWAKVAAQDPAAAHASWMENFTFTRLPGVKMPDSSKPAVDLAKLRQLPPAAVRSYVADGNYGGAYERPDSIMQDIFETGALETRELLENGWAGDCTK